MSPLKTPDTSASTLKQGTENNTGKNNAGTNNAVKEGDTAKSAGVSLDRRARALRANLHRRKACHRARQEGNGPEHGT